MHVVKRTERTLFGHPIGLFVLFLTEMWERFSFYGMRGLLRAYMVYYLFSNANLILYPAAGADKPEGLPLNGHEVYGYRLLRWLYGSDTISDFASHIYGLYGGLVYLTPLFGGIIADRWWGQRRSVVVGAVFMALGHFAMASQQFFFVALGLLIIGNGCFKPNISTQVGDLYPDGDPRRDGAFTIFYMGINIGAFICNFVCATLAATLGWDWGFGAAGVGMLLGLVVYLAFGRYLAPEKPRLAMKAEASVLTRSEWSRIIALVVLCGLTIFYWGVYEQQGNSMQAWADSNTNWPVILGFQVPSAWYQSMNPFMIFMLAPLMDIAWRWQAKRGAEPDTVTKMAIGSFLLGLSFIVMVIGAKQIGDGTGSIWWLVGCVFILTIGELYLSPIGLSLVTKVSPKRMISMMMGMWFLATFFGGYFAGYIGTWYDDMPKQRFFMILSAIAVLVTMTQEVVVKRTEIDTTAIKKYTALYGC